MARVSMTRKQNEMKAAETLRAKITIIKNTLKELIEEAKRDSGFEQEWHAYADCFSWIAEALKETHEMNTTAQIDNEIHELSMEMHKLLRHVVGKPDPSDGNEAGYDSMSDQLNDVIKAGELAEHILTLRKAREIVSQRQFTRNDKKAQERALKDHAEKKEKTNAH
jgi:hypothetical protein